MKDEPMVWPLLAHVLPGEAGLIEGVLHPTFNVEHMVALLALGALCTQADRLLWRSLLVALAGLVLGLALGVLGPRSSLDDYGVGLSLIALGAFTLVYPLQRRAAVLVLALLGTISMSLHGYTLGEAVLPDATLDYRATYIIGVSFSALGFVVGGGILKFAALQTRHAVLIVRITAVALIIFGLLATRHAHLEQQIATLIDNL